MNTCHSPETGKFCEDPSHDHEPAPRIPTDEMKVVRNLDPDIKDEVIELLETRRKVEPHYTHILGNLAKDYSGEMIGLEYSFKKAEGVVEKIGRKVRDKGLTPQEASHDIVDALRYTIGFPPEQYTEGVSAAISALKKQGIEFDSVENNWDRGDAYNGINAVMIDPKSGMKIELQFHTPESFHVKDKVNHEDYTFNRERRGTSAQRLIRHERMRQRADAIQFPKEIDTLSTNIAGVEIKDLFRPFVETLLNLTRGSLLRF